MENILNKFVLKTPFLIFVMAFLYYVTGKLSLELLNANNIVNVGIFASEGFALAFALFFGKRVVWGIFLGQFILAYSNDLSFLASIEISLINSLEALVAIYMFQKFKIDINLKSLRDIIGLTLIISVVLQVMSSTLSSFVLLIHDEIDMGSFYMTLFSWWFGNVMGQLLFAPFLLLLLANYKKINFKNYFLYGFIFGFYLYILEIELNIKNLFLVLSLSIPFLSIVLVKKDMTYGTFLTVISAIVTSYALYIGTDAFNSTSIIDNTINYNLFILTYISVVLIIGILFEERKMYEKNLRNIIDLEVEKNKEQQLVMLQQSRLAQMGEMISMIAHQWRQPLNNLSLVNQIILNKYNKKELNDESIEYFKKNSKKQIEFMSNTIDDFRNFFKTEEIKKEFCVNEVIFGILNMVEAMFKSHGIKINFTPDGKYKILGYPNSLIQIILNIINNSKDAFLERGIKSGVIDIDIKSDNGYIVISISDNGGGIPKDILDKIFDPYFSTKKDKNGTGLGLYMSKMIAEEQMNSKIEVDTKGDKTIFRVFIKGENCVK